MTYLPDLHTYLHQSSLLLQAYPTSLISTKYSLPPKQSTSKPTQPSSDPSSTTTPAKEKRDPSATLTLKTYHPESGICLKYRTDKAAEVGRLMAGLGRLAKGEIIEMPTSATSAADKMDLDVEEKVESGVATPAQQQQIPAAATGGKKKKKGKSGK